MRICIPIIKDRGMESRVSPHFGSAPVFMLIDQESGQRSVVQNPNQHHGHGQCRPLAALAGQEVSNLVVGGIGPGALAKLQAAGIEVFFCEDRTVEQAMAHFEAGALSRVTAQTACGHGHGHGQGHGQGQGGGCAHGKGGGPRSR